MIGNLINLNLFTLTKNEKYLYLPIPFWFLNNYGLAFPLIALQFNTVQVRVSIKNFIDCIKVSYSRQLLDNSVDKVDPQIEARIIDYILSNIREINTTKLEVTMLAEYIYLDSIERKKFAQSAHEYLITQVQEIDFDNLTINNNSFVLDFFHCCKDMYWQVIKKKNYKDIFSLITDGQTSNVYKESTLVGNQRIILNYINTVYKPNYYFNPNDFVVGRALFNNTVYINEFYQSF
jgi:hypothetical protein